jgi:Fe-S cluster assembly protein SufD
MNVEVRPNKTAAEETLAQAFADAKASLPGGDAIQARRDSAFRQFESAGLPHRRVEEWRYTDLRAFMREAKPLAGAPGAEAKERGRQGGSEFAELGARRLVFVDGTFVAEASDLADLEPGLKITSLSDALVGGTTDVLARLSEPGAADGDLAFGLNTAFMDGGAVIEAAEGAKIARPIHLVWVFGTEQAAATFTRSLVIAGAKSELCVVESFEGPDGVDYQVNTALDLSLGDAAIVEHIKVGKEGSAALHVSTITATLGEAAKLRDVTLTVGGTMVRNQLFVRCAGLGASVALSGASLLTGNQHADTTLVMDHAVGGCDSQELFKSVLDDQARAVFQGKIICRKDAQKTDARMMTQALLLSETAEADAKPELEIFADDVQCGHGATAGELDDTLKFYLMARGIPEKEAETMLIESFLGEVIDGIATAAIREPLRAIAAGKLAARG